MHKLIPEFTVLLPLLGTDLPAGAEGNCLLLGDTAEQEDLALEGSRCKKHVKNHCLFTS